MAGENRSAMAPRSALSKSKLPIQIYRAWDALLTSRIEYIADTRAVTVRVPLTIYINW